MNCMPVALFNDRAKAEPVRQNLAATGINATINDHPRLTNLWFVGSHTAGGRIEVPADAGEDQVRAAALTEVAAALEGRDPKKVIIVAGRMVSVVV